MLDDVFDNDIKTNTLTTIPSNFKDIFKASINPLYYYVKRQYLSYLLTEEQNFRPE